MSRGSVPGGFFWHYNPLRTLRFPMSGEAGTELSFKEMARSLYDAGLHVPPNPCNDVRGTKGTARLPFIGLPHLMSEQQNRV